MNSVFQSTGLLCLNTAEPIAFAWVLEIDPEESFANVLDAVDG